MKRIPLFAAFLLIIACSEDGPGTAGPGEGEYTFTIEESGAKYSGKFTNWVLSGGTGSELNGTIVLGPEDDSGPKDSISGLTLVVTTGPGMVYVFAATLSTSDRAVGTSEEVNARLYSFDGNLSSTTQTFDAEVTNSYIKAEAFSIDLYHTIVSPVDPVQFEEKVTVSGYFTAVSR